MERSSSTPKTYPINTLSELADIPPEAFSRFMAELPLLMDAIRDMKKQLRPTEPLTPMIWLDDGGVGMRSYDATVLVRDE